MGKEELEIVKTENTSVALRTGEGFVAYAQDFLKNNGSVVIPPNYDVNDAVKSLYLVALQTVDRQKRPILEVCTKTSIEETIQKYVSKGLNIAKNQCYLVAYGNTLTLQESYFGKQKQARAYAHIKINSNVIYQGEEVKIEQRIDGSKIIHHTPDFSKFDTTKIIGAYAVAVKEDGTVDDSDIMTSQEIKQSWAKGSSGGTVAKEFPVEMHRKTVVSRLAKKYINTSDDSNKFEIDADVDYANEIINANDVVITDNVKEVKSKPVEQPTGTESAEMVIENIDGENIKEISYTEFKDNQDKYRTVTGSYDKVKKTIKVYC